MTSQSYQGSEGLLLSGWLAKRKSVTPVAVSSSPAIGDSKWKSSVIHLHDISRVAYQRAAELLTGHYTRRFFRLDTQLRLMYYSVDGKSKRVTIIPFNRMCSVEQIADHVLINAAPKGSVYGFRLVTVDRVYDLWAENAVSLNNWITCLQQCIAQTQMGASIGSTVDRSQFAGARPPLISARSGLNNSVIDATRGSRRANTTQVKSYNVGQEVSSIYEPSQAFGVDTAQVGGNSVRMTAIGEGSRGERLQVIA